MQKLMNSSDTGFENYLAIETAGGASWHPNELEISFVFNAAGFFQIYKVGVERGKTLWPERLTFESDRCTNPLFLEDGSLIFSRDRGGDENFQIGLIDQKGQLSWISMNLQAKHIINMSANSGFYYYANVEDKARLDFYCRKTPVESSDPEILYRPPKGIPSAQSISEDESKIILQRRLGNDHQELLLLEPSDGSIANLTRAVSGLTKTRWESIRFIDNDHLLVVTDFGSDFKRLGILSVTTQFFPLLDVDLNIEFEEATYSKESPFTYLSFNEDGYSSIYRAKFRYDGVDELELIELPLKGVVTSGDSRSFSRGMTLSPCGKYIAFTLSSVTHPVDVYILDTNDNHFWKATSAGVAGLNRNTFVDVSLHKFQSFDMLEVPYFKHLPIGEMEVNGWPAILMIHGGPESQLRPTFNPVIQFMLSAGFAVIAPNIRGSTGYGRRYMDLDNVEKRLDSIMDIRYLALHLKESDPEIDGNRLVIYGGSYGGFAVLSAMTEHPDLWKAGVDIVGISNFVTFLENTAPWRRSLRESEYGSLKKDRDILEKISPIHKVDMISAPLFIIQGDNDERVPLSESIQIFEKMKDKGIPVEMMRFADEGHGLAKLENKLKAYPAVLKWLKEHV